MEKKTGIITDSNSGITEEEGKKLREGADVKTSQPSPGILLSIWEEMLCICDELVYIPMSSGLSSSVMTAKMLAEEYENRVFVVDNHRIACSQKVSVLEALELRKQGYGGRVTQTGAAIASVMQIKPILQIQGDKLDAYAKARGKNRFMKNYFGR